MRLNEDHRAFSDSVDRFVDAEINPHVDEGDYQGMSQIIVPTDRPGFRVARTFDKLGNRCSDTAELVRSHNLITCEALMAGEDITRMAARLDGLPG